MSLKHRNASALSAGQRAHETPPDDSGPECPECGATLESKSGGGSFGSWWWEKICHKCGFTDSGDNFE